MMSPLTKPAITVLIGHRGAGKTALARRIAGYSEAAGQDCVILDLDLAIEQGENRKITDIFRESGEPCFRELERRYFGEILEECQPLVDSGMPVFISVGAGFSPEESAELRELHWLWVRRPTDPQGRIFLDRPRLNPEHSPIEEFLARYEERQPRFEHRADEQLMVTEGFDQPNEAERDFFQGTLQASGAILTLLPRDFGERAHGLRRWRAFIRKRIPWGIRFEVRDDLLTEQQLQLAFREIPHSQLLFSFRQPRQNSAPLPTLGQGALTDWALELGSDLPPGLMPSIFSLHERGPQETISAAAKRLENFAQAHGHRTAHLKLAVEIRDWSELLEGHRWAQGDSENRSFLPRSSGKGSGRWAWYRLLMKDRRKLNFVREGDGSAPDQPYLLDWVRAPERPQEFAAILGDPVRHSRTPAEQFEFFSQRSMPVLAIAISSEEWGSGDHSEPVLKILRELGLRAAAVTSPLKLLASQAAQRKTPDAEKFDSVNTLLWSDSDQGWIGTNTDIVGLKALLAVLEGNEKVALWGAGGTLPLLQELLPQAVSYSARTGDAREGIFQELPEVVIWGVGRSHYLGATQATWPDSSWNPRLVIDLNYGEDSPGREYAQRIGAKYVSGLEMFTAQAQGQRKFWDGTCQRDFLGLVGPANTE